MAADLVKKFSLIKPRAGMGHAEFLDYWRTQHGPLVAGMPAFWRHYERYIQNHVRPPKRPGQPAPAYTGVAEFWEREMAEAPLRFHQEAIYRERVRPDELKFVDVTDAAIVHAKEHVMLDGPRAKVKFISFLRRRPDITHEQFLRHWQDVHAPLVASVQGFWKHARRYVQNHCIEGSTSGYADKDGDKSGEIAGIVELWFDSMDDYKAAAADPGIALIQEDERRFIDQPSFRLVVEEVEFQA
jgi:uncharacterized protein (TIGR02118 family)